jgi:carbamoylphosphate synthase large subunit
MQKAGLNFPVVVKPDSGMWGVLFRIIKNENELTVYHQKVGSFMSCRHLLIFHSSSVYFISGTRGKQKALLPSHR